MDTKYFIKGKYRICIHFVYFSFACYAKIPPYCRQRERACQRHDVLLSSMEVHMPGPFLRQLWPFIRQHLPGRSSQLDAKPHTLLSVTWGFHQEKSCLGRCVCVTHARGSSCAAAYPVVKTQRWFCGGTAPLDVLPERCAQSVWLWLIQPKEVTPSSWWPSLPTHRQMGLDSSFKWSGCPTFRRFFFSACVFSHLFLCVFDLQTLASVAVSGNIRRWKSKQCYCQANTICYGLLRLWPPPRLAGLMSSEEGLRAGSHHREDCWLSAFHVNYVSSLFRSLDSRVKLSKLMDLYGNFLFLSVSVKIKYLLYSRCLASTAAVC